MTTTQPPAELTQTIPYTAWEQAVFVALFVAFVLSLLLWFSKQQGAWQQFISERDNNWQKFLADQRADDKRAIGDLATRTDAGFRTLTEATAKLAEALARLHSDVDVHIADENAMLGVMLDDRQKQAIERRKSDDAGNPNRRRKTDGGVS